MFPDGSSYQFSKKCKVQNVTLCNTSILQDGVCLNLIQLTYLILIMLNITWLLFFTILFMTSLFIMKDLSFFFFNLHCPLYLNTWQLDAHRHRHSHRLIHASWYVLNSLKNKCLHPALIVTADFNRANLKQVLPNANISHAPPGVKKHWTTVTLNSKPLLYLHSVNLTIAPYFTHENTNKEFQESISETTWPGLTS